MLLTDQIRRLVADVLRVPVEQLGPRSSPDDIESWDSLRHLNLVLAIEQEFELQFTPEEIEQLLSVELIELLVEEKRKVVR